MIHVTRADDLDRQAQRLEAEAIELERVDESQAGRARQQASELRHQAAQLRRGRGDGVRFG